MKQALHLELYLKTNEHRLYRLAYSYMHNDADTKDMLQNAAIKAFQGLPKLRQADCMDTWFYRILINTCLDELRKQSHMLSCPLQEDIPMENKESSSLSEELYQLLYTLDAKTRTILILRFFEERKLEEIANILSLPLSTVKSRLYKGLKDLRIQMEDDQCENNEKAASGIYADQRSK